MEQNRRILIVDDQNDLREQLAQLLLNCGRPNKTASMVRSMRARLMGIDSMPSERTNLPCYDIDTASQGEEALELVKAALANHAPYAVMFIDMRMPPGWDGLQTSCKIREIDKNLEIVVMTAFADHTQEDLARQIGTPDKLLYIKKPFQAEEICQFALSLCAKWNVEARAREHYAWLEKLIGSLRKIRQYDTLQELHRRILEAFISFFEAPKGLMAEWQPETQSWHVPAVHGLETESAELILKKQQSFLLETATLSAVDEFQIIPLREHGCGSFVLIGGAKTSEDQIWFQDLNILTLTALEQLEIGRKLEQRFRNCPSAAKLEDIRSIATALKRKYLGDPEIAQLVARLNDISY